MNIASARPDRPNASTGARPPCSAACSEAETETEAEAEEDCPRGCGWFDSSHELRTGLLVTEHDSPDRVANELALDVWLAWHLAGPSCGASACA